MREGSITLPDGRSLAYTQQGDPQGNPVIFIHGNPGSRYSVHPDETIADQLGVRGWVREAKIPVSSWDFPLQEVQTPIHLWYWEEDPSIPLQMGRYLAAELPNATPHFLPLGGHLAVFSHWRAILSALISEV